MPPPMGMERGETVPWVGSCGVLLDVGVGSEVVVPWVATGSCGVVPYMKMGSGEVVPWVATCSDEVLP